MRISRWLFAAGLLSFSGLALAEDDVNNNNINNDTTLMRSKKKHNKPHIDEGKDVRTSYEQNKAEVKQDVKDTAQDVKEGAQETAQDASQSAAESVRQGARQGGNSLSQAIREGGNTIAGTPSPLPMGEVRDGKIVHNTITTDPLGTALGSGLNAEYSRGVGSKFAVVGGARFARTYAAEDFVTNFGVRLGADYFILGRNNEGLRIGPRADLSLGNVSGGGQLLQSSNGTAFRDLGLGGELGYNWIAVNGITAGAAAGLMGHTASATTNDVRIAGGSFGPYGKINLGYSW